MDALGILRPDVVSFVCTYGFLKDARDVLTVMPTRNVECDLGCFFRVLGIMILSLDYVTVPDFRSSHTMVCRWPVAPPHVPCHIGTL